ncbi:hypothetical protein RYX36_035031 [Vicia faba]
MASIGGPNMNMSEALRANNISTPHAQPNQQTLPGAGTFREDSNHGSYLKSASFSKRIQN